MTAITNNNIAESIYLSLKGKSVALQPKVIKEVVQFLARKHLLGRSSEILSALEKITNKAENKIAVKVVSVEKLKEDTKVNLAKHLKKRYSADAIVFDEQIDKKLIGGLRLEVNDEVIDLSIKNKIHKLQAHLTQN